MDYFGVSIENVFLGGSIKGRERSSNLGKI